MKNSLVRLINLTGAVTLAVGIAACTVHNSETPGLSGPSGAVGPITLPAQSPTARFSFAPSSPAANSLVAFDGTLSCGGLADPSGTAPCVPSNYPVTSYSWNFGDGDTTTGLVASHSFDTAGSYTVRLTVSNSAGLSHTTGRALTVVAGLLPTAAFTFSPTAPRSTGTIVFNGNTSTPGIGHSIVGWSWDMGDNSPPKSGAVITHSYTVAASTSYIVVLTVVDESGQTKSTSATVTVIP